MSNKIRLSIIVSVLILAMVYMVYAAFPGSAMYYVTVDELAVKSKAGELVPGQRVRVVGRLVPDSFERKPGTLEASFSISNQGEVLRAQYNRPIPDTFFSPQNQVVLEGTYGPDALFHADDVTVKCPSKYESLPKEKGI